MKILLVEELLDREKYQVVSASCVADAQAKINIR